MSDTATVAAPGKARGTGMGRLLAAVVGPVLALILFGAYVVHEKLADYRGNADLLAAAQLARAAHTLSQELQVERTLTAEFVGEGRARWAAQLEDQRIATDSRLEDFRRLLAAPPVRALFGHAVPDSGTTELETLRAGADGDWSVKPLVQGYDRLTARVTGFAAKAAGEGPNNLITAYIDLGNVRDRIVRERTLGMAWLLGSRPDRDLIALIGQAHAEAKAYASSFRGHASGEQLRVFNELVRGPVLDEIDALQKKALAGTLTSADTEAWQKTHDQVATLLGEVEDRLATGMEHDIAHHLEAAKIAFYGVLATVLLLVVASIEVLRRSERRISVAEETAHRLLRAVEQSPVSVMITNISGLIDYVNPAFTAMTGFSREEVLGHNPRLLRSEDTPKELFAAMWQAIRRGQDWRGEFRNRRKNGELYWEKMTVAPVRGPDGDIVNYIALKEDVSEVKSLRSAVEREHDNLRRILNSITDPIALIDADGDFELVNPALLGEFGPLRNAHGDTYFPNPLPPADPEQAVRADWRSDKTGHVYEVSSTPVARDDGVVLTLRVFHDITLRKKAEEAMAAAAAAAEAANRAKTGFLAAMSHELRTPLNAIIGFSEIMGAELLGPLGQPSYVDYARDITSSGRHLLRLINDILDIANLDVDRLVLDKEEVDIHALVTAAGAMVSERALEKNHVLTVEAGDDLALLWADPMRLKQILMALLDNAIKYTPSGGHIAVKAVPGENGAVVLSVSDDGVGIAADDIEKAMTPFGPIEDGTRPLGGAGLGLPLARKLTELHGGHLDMISAPGRGTTVNIRLPSGRAPG